MNNGMSDRINDATLIIIGAGAAGLWAAARAARMGVETLIVEKTARIGTKILASGGSRCNLTTSLSAQDAARLFGPSGERFLRHALRALPPEAVRARFEALGVPTVTAPLDKVFPASGRATDVRDALERDARDMGARIMLNAPVSAVAPYEGGWRVELSDGRALTCRAVMLCAGGMSYPKSGTTGDGWRWLRALGLPIVPPVPALVGLTSGAPWVATLAGVDAQDAAARMLGERGVVLGERRRPVLFTHKGISGPGAMDLAHHLSRALAQRAHDAPAPQRTLSVDLYPDLSADMLDAALRDAASARGKLSIWRALPEGPPRSLLQAALDQAGAQVAPGETLWAQQISKALRAKIVRSVKGLAVPVDGTLGFEHAEVSDGGLSLDVVDPKTMEVRDHPGLYVFGELLDLTGPIGGLNFLAAWSCAELAADAAARRLKAQITE
jgi:predicted Rossmann fold flavoprotein